MTSFLLCMLAAFLQSARPAIGAESYWRSQRCCGANCTYLILRANKCNADYTDLQHALVTDKYPTLHDISGELKRHGISMLVGKATSAELPDLGMPIIAHFEKVQNNAENVGHFVVVTEATSGYVTFIDGTTAEMRTLTIEKFERLWSGYFLGQTLDFGWARWLRKGFVLPILLSLPCLAAAIMAFRRSASQVAIMFITLIALSGYDSGQLIAQDSSEVTDAIEHFDRREAETRTIHLDAVEQVRPLVSGEEYYKLTGNIECASRIRTVIVASDGRTLMTSEQKGRRLQEVLRRLAKLGRLKGDSAQKPDYAEVQREFANVAPVVESTLHLFDGERLLKNRPDSLSLDGVSFSHLDVVDISTLRGSFFPPNGLDFCMVTFRCPQIPKDDAYRQSNRISDLLRKKILRLSQPREIVRGVECVKFESDDEEVWVAPGKGYVVLKRRKLIDGKPLWDSESFDLRQITKDFWFPNTLVLTTYGHPKAISAKHVGLPVFSTHIQVVNIEVNAPNDSNAFHFEPSGGDFVFDQALAKKFNVRAKDGEVPSISYRMPANREELDDVIESAVVAKRPRAQFLNPAVLATIAVALVAVLSFTLMRYRPRSR